MLFADIFVQPDIRRHRITVTARASQSGDVTATVEGEAPVHARLNEPFTVDIRDYTLWRPGTAQFYHLTVNASIDGHVDSQTIPFAMREVTVKDHRIVINNRPQFLRALRLVPETGVAPDRAWFQRILGAGFNAVVLPDSMAATEVLDDADRTGVLLFVGVNAVEFVQANRNRACIAGWLLPDSIDFPAIRELDPTRIVLNLCEGASRYVRPYRDEPQQMDYMRIGIDYPPTRAAENLLRNAGHDTLLSLVETAWISVEAAGPEFEEPIKLRRQRLGDLAVRELRANVKVAGYILPATAVQEDDLPLLQQANADVAAAIQMQRTNLVPRQEAPVTVTFVNEERLEGRADLSMQVVGPTNQVLWKKKRNVKIPRHGRELWSGTVAASGSTGRHQVAVRLQSGARTLAEASHPFDVFKPLEKTDQHIDVVAGSPEALSTLEKLGYHLTPSAPVVLVPHIANTIRAYPDNELAHALGRAYTGAVAIVFAPPDDWNEFAELVSSVLAVGVHEVNPMHELVFRTARLHPVFDNLPTRSTMGRAYAGVIGRSIGTGDSEEDIATGTLMNAAGPVSEASDIVVRKYGSGRVVFSFLDPFDLLGQDPLADRLLDNLVRHFARRSLPSEGAFPAHQRAVEWLREQRTRRIRRWQVIGPFPNPGRAGLAESFPPEQGLDLAATYPGWFAAVFWKPYYVIASDGVQLPLDRACREHHRAVSIGDSGTYYAYSEITSDQRGRARLQIDSRHAVACWFNRAEVIRSAQSETLADPVTHEATVPLRQGRNSILVKCVKTAGLADVHVRLTPADEPVTLRWWN